MSLKTLLSRLIAEIKRISEYITTYKPRWDSCYTLYSSGNNSQILTRSDWLPSGANYGVSMRLRGTSYPGYWSSDSYFICVDSQNRFYVGIQVNGATTITWKQIT